VLELKDRVLELEAPQPKASKLYHASIVGGNYTIPTERGYISWKPESWGAVVTEFIEPGWQPRSRVSIRLPYKVARAILDTEGRDV
jgi:hypothetical protein